jgi:hypothetical protein
MTLTIEFCEARAREAADEAHGASLDNVRERALRSQAAWQAMADRAIGIAKTRALKLLEAQQEQDRSNTEPLQEEAIYGPQ